MCHLCKTDTETLCHLFYHCRVSYSLILKVERALNVLITDEFYVPGAIRIQLKHTILGFPHNNYNIQILVYFVLHLLKWELWKHRNGIKFENRMISENRFFWQFSK